MRKILSLLLILALFLPCALAETPQGIDLALTSTWRRLVPAADGWLRRNAVLLADAAFGAD